MQKTYVWFCGPSGVGKTWLSGKCRNDLALCKELRLIVSPTDDIREVRELADESAIAVLTQFDSPFVFIHWQTSYDDKGYGVQRLRQAAPDARHVVLEIHRADDERLKALRQKDFVADKTDELGIYKKFFLWSQNDYAQIRKHVGTVDHVQVFLDEGRVYRMERID